MTSFLNVSIFYIESGILILVFRHIFVWHCTEPFETHQNMSEQVFLPYVYSDQCINIWSSVIIEK